MLTPKQARKSKEISVEKMAKLLGISASSLRTKEKGKSRFYFEEAIKICQATGYQIDEINFIVAPDTQNDQNKIVHRKHKRITLREHKYGK